MSAGRGRGVGTKAREPLREPEAAVLERVLRDQPGVVPSNLGVSAQEESTMAEPHTAASDTPLSSSGQPTVGRGRGRGRGRSQQLREPDPEVLERATQPGTVSSTASDQPSDVSPSQFESSEPHTPTSEPPPPSDLLSSSTTSADSATIPLASEIKEAIKQGTKVIDEAQPVSPDDVYSGKKMNPDAPSFVPAVNSSPISNDGLGVSPSLPAKHPPLSSGINELSSALNPNVIEFVPSKKPAPKLNAAAPDFVPVGLILQNGDPNQDFSEEIDFEPLQENAAQFSVQDPNRLIEGFERPAMVLESEVECVDGLLELCAEMLIKATLYPASFEYHHQRLQDMMTSQPLSKEAHMNLAEMLIHWGITESWLYYTSCKLGDMLCNQNTDFRVQYLNRLAQWYNAKKDMSVSSDEEKYMFLNFCMFLAEMFSRIRVGESTSPIKPLAKSVFEIVTRLLAIGDNITVGGACNILKLTGALLMKCDEEGKMEKLITTVKSLTLKSHFDSKSGILMQQVIQLHSSKWGCETTPIPSQSPPFDGDENTYQSPVTNPDEWNEFPLEDQYYEETGGFDGSDGIDAEIEQEYEAFIEEMEEHLMRQEFGD